MERRNSKDHDALGIREALSRKAFLRMSGAGIAGLALFGAAVPAFGQTAPTYTSAHDLGIHPDNDGITNRENLVKALRYSSRNVTFPPGEYYIDNSIYATIEDYEGELMMEEGARLVFTDSTKRGITFNNGDGARFEGLNATYRTLPSERSYESTIIFLGTTDTAIRNASVEGSNAIGLALVNCVRPIVEGTLIRNVMADGLHFANCQDARVDGLTTENTGDDGLAIHNFAHDPDRTGAVATNITVRDSKARGIAVGGQSGVTIDGFEVDGTSFSGLWCTHDEYFNTRVPSNVLFMNGEVRNAGTVVDPAGKFGNHNGIEIDTVDSVEFKNITVISPADKGVSGVATEGLVRLTNIEVRDVPNLDFSHYAA